MSDVLVSFHFQLLQLICFLQLLLLVCILLFSLATVPSGITPLLLPSQGLSDLLTVILSTISSITFQNRYLHLLPLCLVWESPCPGFWHLLQCHLTVCSSDEWLGLCTQCLFLICKATKASCCKSLRCHNLEMQSGPASCSHRHW